MLDMEYAASYKTEGFSNPDMNSVFNTLLRIKPNKNIHPRKVPQESSKPDGTSCAPSKLQSGQTPLTMEGVNLDSDTESISFLKTMLIQQKKTADSLMNTAKRIGPAAKRATQMENAYEAAFESDTLASLPRAGGTLQGFILLFFFVSYISLALVTTLAVNAITGSMQKAAGTFVGFIVIGIILMALISRLA